MSGYAIRESRESGQKGGRGGAGAVDEIDQSHPRNAQGDDGKVVVADGKVKMKSSAAAMTRFLYYGYDESLVRARDRCETVSVTNPNCDFF